MEFAQALMTRTGIHTRVQLYNDRIKERELMGARVLPSLLEMKDINKQALSSLFEKRKNLRTHTTSSG